MTLRTRTTPSIGCAFTISSVSTAIRFRRYMLVGCAKLSCRLIVGNGTGSAPESITPRSTALMSEATFPWHGLKPDEVSMMPMMGLSSASSE